MAKDVVCGMQVDEQRATSKGLTSDYQGQTFYFCSPGCKQEFEKNPQQYAAKQAGQS